ncbi:ribosomal RNA small subunit methyltransferase D [Rothia aeria]|uniref:Ribosomal RNA small subunit methyltransferase D n=1 Tax=Rothia aeria TaxID=172042 RepID=A0A2Z5R1J1_9MICC|nr:ribosomal RNA small subunit methyltransferase D [Rothia aeria]
MSRIIAGAAGGLRLASVPGDTTRPTTDRVKESLFSKLESYGVLEGARVLDVYGGSGR